MLYEVITLRTDVVRIALDDYPAFRLPLGEPDLPPLTLAAAGTPGFTVDGVPVRVVPSDDPTRPRWLPGQQPVDVELVVRDVPAFGCRRLRLVITSYSIHYTKLYEDGQYGNSQGRQKC